MYMPRPGTFKPRAPKPARPRLAPAPRPPLSPGERLHRHVGDLERRPKHLAAGPGEYACGAPVGPAPRFAPEHEVARKRSRTGRRRACAACRALMVAFTQHRYRYGRKLRPGTPRRREP